MSQNKQTNRFHNWKNTKFAGMAVTLAILVLVIAVVLNMIVSRLDFSWDISPNKQYSLSSTTEKYLDQLDSEGKTVDFYILTTKDSLENDMSSLTLYRALEAYDAHKSINLIWVDPDTDNDTMEKINSDNAFTLSTGDMVFICDNVKKRVPGSSMYTVYTDDDGNTTGEDFKGENLITGTIKGECVIGVDLLHGVVVGVRIYPDQVDRLVGIISFQCPIEGEGTHIVFQTVLGGQNVKVYRFSLAVQLIQIFFRGGAQTVLLVGRNVPAEVQTGNDHVQNHSNDQHQNGKRHCHAGEFGVFPVVETVCLFVLTHSSLPPAPASFFNGNDSPDQEYRDFRYISQQVGELHQTLGEYIEFGLVREPAQYIREHRNAGEERVDTQVVHQDQHQHGKFA